MAEPHIHTYHCICTELVLATFTPLINFPRRKGDGAKICKITKSDLPAPEAVVLSGSTLDESTPTILKLDDGFEKRYHVQCRRCDLKIGYRLDKSQFRDAAEGIQAGVLYLFPGALISTEDMKDGKATTNDVDIDGTSAG